MLKREHAILKYIKKNQPVSEKDLRDKFTNFDLCITYISSFIVKRDTDEAKRQEDMIKFFDSQRDVPVGKVKEYVSDLPINQHHILYTLSHCGEEYFEKKTHDAWLFWFPYAVTTIIAMVAVLSQILSFI